MKKNEIKLDDAAARLQEAKKLGKFYTPESVCRLLVQLAVKHIPETGTIRVYDPTCGAGSTLCYAFDSIGARGVYCGQELDANSARLARENLQARGATCEIVEGDTLVDPYQWSEPFDVIVGNPPFSLAWSQTLPMDPRFNGLLAPKGKADLAFIQHSLYWLKPGGRAAFVMFPGVAYRGGVEEKIRQRISEAGELETVVQLPPGLFQETGIATIVVVLRKKT